MNVLFDRAALLDAIGVLASELAAGGVSANIRIVGGAALSLNYFDRPVTTDVDALLFGDVAAVSAKSVELARRNDWPDDWLNDAVKAFFPFAGNPAWVDLAVQGAVSVQVAPADMLLAMKLNSARGARDRPDIDRLLDLCRVTTVQQAEAIFDEYYPGESMKGRAYDQLRTKFDPAP